MGGERGEREGGEGGETGNESRASQNEWATLSLSIILFSIHPIAWVKCYSECVYFVCLLLVPAFFEKKCW